MGDELQKEKRVAVTGLRRRRRGKKE